MYVSNLLVVNQTYHNEVEFAVEFDDKVTRARLYAVVIEMHKQNIVRHNNTRHSKTH